MLRLTFNLLGLLILLSFSDIVISKTIQEFDFYGIKLGQTKQAVKNKLEMIKSDRTTGIRDKGNSELIFNNLKNNRQDNILFYFDKYENNKLVYIDYKKKYDRNYLTYNELYDEIIKTYGQPNLENKVNGAILKTLCWGNQCDKLDELVKIKSQDVVKNQVKTKFIESGYILVINFNGLMNKVKSINYQLIDLGYLVKHNTG